MTMPQTVFALASAPGRAGIAVIRLSGPKSRAIAHILTGRDDFTPRTAQMAPVFEPDGTTVIDRALVLVFPGPNSFTGEDVVEFHLHGGPAIIEAIYEALTRAGAVLAAPGEFSRRAFENDKIDLLQAEAIADLIDAQTTGQRRQAARQLGGALGETYQDWAKTLLRIRARIEACIDFPEEEDVTDIALEEVGRDTKALIRAFDAHLSDGARAQRVRSGFLLALLGPVNAGKSTLLNRLAGEEAAIVSDEPGTTRDIIKVRLDLGGFAVDVADSAGLRAGVGAIEREGVRRAKDLAQNADMRVFVLDGAQTSLPDESVQLVRPGDFLVLNKADKADLQAGADFAPFEPGFIFSLSAKTGAGVEVFLNALEQKVVQELSTGEAPGLTRQRHRIALQNARAALIEAARALAGAPELAGEHVRAAADALGEITGKTTSEDVLGEIFSGFCIGK